jgi:hypothetical protein
MLTTHNSRVSYEGHCYLSPSARCMQIDTHFSMYGKTAMFKVQVSGNTVQKLFVRDSCTPVTYYSPHPFEKDRKSYCHSSEQ